MVFKIGNRTIGLDSPPYIIAELSANHNGSLDRALKTIDMAQQCGADAIKIQTYTADTMTIDSELPDFIIDSGPWRGYKLYDLYKSAETPYEWHREIFEHAKMRGITIFSTPFDETAVDLLEQLNTPAYKIASFELLDLALIRYVANTGKPLILSTGMASEAEIYDAILAAREGGCENLIVLHCISSYPAPIEQANLRQIQTICQQFEVLTGLSDHTMGTVASVAAVALGACLIEKHFTLSRSDKGPDSEFSLEPREFESLCRDARDAWLAIGQPGFQRQNAEAGSKIFRRSLYIVKDMKAGEVLAPENLRRIRPGFGLSPKHYESLLGREVCCDITKGTALQHYHLQNY